MKLNIPEYAEKILDRLDVLGYDAYLVGGCVRDTILGKVPDDFDITTEATPDVLLEIFSSDGFSAIPTGISHGTVTVVFRKNAIEVTTYRIDGEYSDFRHPKSVLFTPSLAEDLKRRDFTINAMAYSHQKGLIDLYGGACDLENRIIRAVGSPEKRFSEDALRIIRAIRFSSVLDFTLDEATETAARVTAPLLKNISMERISAELKKLIMGKASSRVLSAYGDIIFPIMGADAPCGDFSLFSKLSAELFVRLAALYVNRPSEYIRERLRALRFDGETVKLTAALADNRDFPICDYIAAKRLCCKLGIRLARGIAVFRIYLGLEKAAVLEYFDKIEADSECISPKGLAVNGDDLATLGFEGEEIGRMLCTLLDSVIDGTLKNESAALIEAAQNIKYQRKIKL